MSAPKGAASISDLILPSKSVVVGDTMRDSLGAVAPLSVIAYDANSVPIAGLASAFFITDSASASVAHLSKNTFVIGDKQGSVHVIGQISGIQTNPATVLVTVAPETLALATKLPDTLAMPLLSPGDTSSKSIANQPLAVTLKGVGDTATVGWAVTYQLVSAPPTSPGVTTPAVFIGTDAISKPSLVAITDGSGATRSIIVKTGLLATPSKADSVVVLISASYKGKPVKGSPIRVALPVKLTFAL
jgi:hypothetical protein